MNKYQETIYNLVHLNKARGEVFIDHKQLQQDIDILWELYNKYDELTKTPTLEEVKKEWEELGYDLTRHERLFLEFEKGDTYIMLYNYETVKYEKYSYAYSQKITLKEHQLLTKTFRALGWEV